MQEHQIPAQESGAFGDQVWRRKDAGRPCSFRDKNETYPETASIAARLMYRHTNGVWAALDASKASASQDWEIKAGFSSFGATACAGVSTCSRCRCRKPGALGALQRAGVRVWCGRERCAPPGSVFSDPSGLESTSRRIAGCCGYSETRISRKGRLGQDQGTA